MKKLLFLFIIVWCMLCLCLVSNADVYVPDNDGVYEFTLEFESGGEYVLFALKGEYDVTNYIEAFNAADDEDIIYFDQKAADEDAKVTFGPFVPSGYFDATLIVIGTNLDEPQIAGYLSTGGAENNEKIVISGVEDTYVVEGKNGSDYVADIKTKVYDSFGYESFSGQAPELFLIEAKEGVILDAETGTLTIQKNAKQQLFAVAARIGDTTGVKYVNVVRDESKTAEIKFFDSPESTQPAASFEVAGADGNYPEITIYVKSFDQYGDEISDSYIFYFDGKPSANVIKPTREGSFEFSAQDENGSVLSVVPVKSVKYEKNSLALYKFVKVCQDELSKLGTTKFVCDENGKSVFSPNVWTTSASKTAFENALTLAQRQLETYNGQNDGELADDLENLQTAYNTYISSFKTGIRKDVQKIYFKKDSYTLEMTRYWQNIAAVTEPRLSATTDKITYISSDPAIAEVNADGEVKVHSGGVVTITATTRGGLEAVTTVNCYRKVTDIKFDDLKYTAEHGKTAVVVDAKISPNNTGDTFVWSLENPELAELVAEDTLDGQKCTVIPKKSGKTKIKILAVNSGVSSTAELTVIMPDWATAEAPFASQTGNVKVNTKVALISDTVGATIYYTLDGTVPSRTNGRVYSSPITISKDLTIKAFAVMNGMYDSEVVTYEYNALDRTASVSNAVTSSGKNVKIDVSLYDFADISSADIEITYDSTSLEIANVSFADGIEISESQESADGKYVISLAQVGSAGFNGKAATIEFSVDAAAENADYVLAAVVKAFDVSGEPVNVKIKNGTITVRDYVLGDANDDGKIGLEDVLIIKQYNAGNENAQKNILLVAADVNGDGVVDKNDSSLIAQYCVGLLTSLN